MGRPIKKQYIGNTAITGNQIRCYARFPGDVTGSLSYIQEQLGTGRYVAVKADGSKEGIVTLANTDGGNLTVGQASVIVDPVNPALPTAYAQVIYDNTVRVWDGTSYKWYWSSSDAPSGEILAAVIQNA